MQLLPDRRLTPPDAVADRRVCWSCDQYFDYDPDDVSGGGEVDGRATCPECLEYIYREARKEDELDYRILIMAEIKKEG